MSRDDAAEQEGLALRDTVLAGLIIVLLLAGAGGGLYFYGPCGLARVRGVNAELDVQLTRLDDVLADAYAAGRDQLAGPLAELHDVKQVISGQRVPGCMREAHAEIEAGVDLVLESFIRLEQGAEVSDVVPLWATSLDHITTGNQIRAAVLACAPRCSASETTAQATQ